MDADRAETSGPSETAPARPPVHWKHRAEFLVFRTLVALIEALPRQTCDSLARGLAWCIHHLLPRKLTRYHVARDNLRQSFGDRYSDQQMDDLIHRMWIHLFRMVGEIVLMPRKLRVAGLTEAIEFRNKGDVLRAMASGRPVLLLSGHYGNWEMAVSVFGLFGFPMGLVARDLDNPLLHRWFQRFRRYTGHVQIGKKGGSGLMVEQLERRGSLALLGDQDAGGSGLFVEFFGRPASTFKSIGLLAMEYEALICVGFARRLDSTTSTGWPRFELGCEEVIDPRQFDSGDALREITQRYTAALERVIRRAPEQYFWVHRRWKSVPKTREKREQRKLKRAG
ncbi:MAG: lysophospholipid acyltransferase family protein [Planctomycetota bacterium]|nr:lysophospholipid acyltransferase family protein [Planctomycetota bacterium]